MKKFVLFGLVSLGFIGSMAQSSLQQKPGCELSVKINANFSKGKDLDSILQSFALQGLPGVAMAVYTDTEGWWASAKGYAQVETGTLMNNCHLQYLQSVSKSYMAVEILQLKEQGRIVLDTPITRYLPQRFARYIPNAGKITVRMLLNQNSGVPEYNSHPVFVSQVMQHPLDNFSAEDCLKSIAKEKSRFTPGSKYAYTNTNYLLLSLIGDAVTGDHAAYIKKNIFQPLGLRNTYYGKDHNYLNGAYLPDSYWDVFNTRQPANITQFQQMTVVSSKGDDGIVCTPVDAIKFLKGLMEGKLLNPESMKEMMDFVKDEKGNPRYGMGMAYFDLGGLPAYGHGGGGVGAGCGLLYVPSHKTYVFFATNLGVLLDGDLATKAGEMRDAILSSLLR